VSRQDALTGLTTALFYGAFFREFDRARRYHQPLAVLMIDLDLFKKINDTCVISAVTRF
jgi:diguanylate cyclase (GGDEF)-like protein